MGFEFCHTLKLYLGLPHDGRHPNNNISLSLVPVLKLDFCAYCKVFDSEVSIGWTILMIAGHGSHFEVILKLIYTENILFSRMNFIIDVSRELI